MATSSTPVGEERMTTVRLSMATSLALIPLLTACRSPSPPAAVIQNQIISSSVSGSADDADPIVPPQQYPTAANPQSATDGATKAASDPPVFNQVRGNSHAIPGTRPVGEAVAKSNSRVLTRCISGLNRTPSYCKK
jgi:hypothetical protein